MSRERFLKHWWVYVLKCSDDSLYTGYTDDVEKRVAKHMAGKGAKFTRSRLPLKLLWLSDSYSKSLVMKKEAFIKSLNRKQKITYMNLHC